MFSVFDSYFVVTFIDTQISISGFLSRHSRFWE